MMANVPHQYVRRLSDALTAMTRWRRFKSDQSGAAFVFALVIFVLMLVMGGMAVDVMRMEAQRMKVQATVDRAVLAAADLENSLDPEAVVNDYFTKAGLADMLDDVAVEQAINSKTVTVETSSEVATLFLNMVGVNALEAEGAGAAKETISDIEISMVIDVSGSMGNSSRLVNLKLAAAEFFDIVMDNDPDKPGLTSVSIVPYNAHVNLGWDLAAQVNFDNSHSYSACGRFRDDSVRDDFTTTAISDTTYIERNGHFQYYSPHTNNYAAPTDASYWCAHDDNRHILVHETDPQVLTDFVDAFWADGWTAIDQGMRWGAALLDPAFEPVVDALVTADDAPDEVKGRPAAFDDSNTMKVIVLMTDGANTDQRDLRSWAKYKYSPVWFSQAAADETGNWWDGYYVDLNYENTPSDHIVPGWRDWYRPRSPWDNWDDEWMGWHARDDAVRQTYQDLLKRFTIDDLQKMMWRWADYDSRNWSNQNDRPTVWDYDRHNSIQEKHTGRNAADSRVEDFCDLINDDKTKNIQIFAVAFEAPTGGQDVMKHCASTDSNYYDVDGLDIVSAFTSIASQINQLRLIQ